jgi:hypothetical protein
MNNISIYSDTDEEHGQHVRAAMNILRKHNFKVKDRKCTCGRSETDFVGYRVNGDGIRLLERKIVQLLTGQWLLHQKMP